MTKQAQFDAKKPWITSKPRWFRFCVTFYGAWLIMDLCYLSYTLANTLFTLLSLARNRKDIMNLLIRFTNYSNYVMVHSVLLWRGRAFEELTLKLVRGQLNWRQDERALNRTIRRCFRCLLLGITLIIVLNVSEVLIAHHVAIYLYELIDFVTFGHARVLGEAKCRAILWADCFFYISLCSSLTVAWCLFLLFSLTLSDAAKKLKEEIEPISSLNELAIEDIHASFDDFQRSVRQTDHLFSTLLFLWYFDALLSALTGIMYMVRTELGKFGFIYSVFNYFANSAVVLGMTFVASRIPIHVLAMRRSLLDVSGRTRFETLPPTLYLLLKRMSAQENGLTAAGVFIISRSVCLSFVGFLITYIIVLVSSGLNMST